MPQQGSGRWGSRAPQEPRRSPTRPRDPPFRCLCKALPARKARLFFGPGLHFLEMSGTMRVKLGPKAPEQLGGTPTPLPRRREAEGQRYQESLSGVGHYSGGGVRVRAAAGWTPGAQRSSHRIRSIPGSSLKRGYTHEGHLVPMQLFCLDTLCPSHHKDERLLVAHFSHG